MKILVSAVNQVQKLTKAGKGYTALEIKFQINGQGKEFPKTIMPFGDSKPVFDALSSGNGKYFEIEEVQSGQFKNWVKATPVEGGDMPANKSPKSNYETAEERAARQLMIVRQSSISNAVGLLTLRGDKKVDELEVLRVAEVFVNYVLNGFEDSASNLVNMEDDIPY